MHHPQNPPTIPLSSFCLAQFWQVFFKSRPTTSTPPFPTAKAMSWSRVDSLSPFQIGLLAPKGWSPTRMLCVSSVFLARVVYLWSLPACGVVAPTHLTVLMGLDAKRCEGVTPSAKVCIFSRRFVAPPLIRSCTRLFSPLYTHRRPPPPPPQHHGLRPCRHRLRRGLLGHSLPSHLHRYVRRGSSLFYLWGVVGRTGNEIQRVCTSYKQASGHHTHTLSTTTTPAYLDMSRGPADPLQRSGQKPHRA